MDESESFSSFDDFGGLGGGFGGGWFFDSCADDASSVLAAFASVYGTCSLR